MASHSVLDSFAASAFGLLKAVLWRLLVHLAALATVFFYFQTHIAGMSDMLLAVPLYAGIICLIPYGSIYNPYWFFPVVAGTAQYCVLLALNVPFEYGLYTAGLLAWTMRLVIAKGDIGWDWTASPILIAGLIICVQDILFFNADILPFASFPAILLAGWLVYQLFTHFFSANVHKEMLTAALVRLRRLLQARNLNDREKQLVSVMLSQCEALAFVRPCPDALVDRIVNITGDLEDVARALDNKPAWTQKVFRSTQWSHLGQNTSIQGGRTTRENVLASVVAMNRDLARFLAGRKKDVSQGSAQTEEAKLSELTLSANALLEKKASLPQSLAYPAEQIAFAALDLISTMRSMPGEQTSALAFLGKYLPRVHHVVDEFSRLQGSLPYEATQRTAEILRRMAESFEGQKQGLSRSDTISYTAELDAIDTLLKMSAR